MPSKLSLNQAGLALPWQRHAETFRCTGQEAASSPLREDWTVYAPVRTLFCRLQPSHQLFVLFCFSPPRPGTKKRQEGKKGRKKERNPSLGCLTLSIQVCLYAPLFLISTVSVPCAFFTSGVVLPLSLQRSAPTAHTCLVSCCQPPLCKRRSLGIRQGLHVTRQGFACLLGHALLCPKRLVGFSSPPFAAYPAAGRGAISHLCLGGQN